MAGEQNIFQVVALNEVVFKFKLTSFIIGICDSKNLGSDISRYIKFPEVDFVLL